MPTPAERRALLFIAALAALGVSVRGYRAWNPATIAGREDAGALTRQIAAVDAAVGAAGNATAAGAKRTARRTAKRGAVTSGSAESGAGDSVRRRAAASTGAAPYRSDPLALYEARRLAVERSNAEARARVNERAAEVAAPSAPQRAQVSPSKAVSGGAERPAPAALIDMDTAGEDAIASLPRIGPVLAANIVADRAARGPFGSLAALQRVRGVGPALAARIGSSVTFSRAGSAGLAGMHTQTVPNNARRP